ncbi:hypothetical protein FRZ06_01065 [Anoxybacterium hadale]|uniref:Uncharacterized protein n=2 Tax=Anoxybacterium hadale TaxID=3408580 RepID=A0ACD1AGS5_9FIRM|nr:hypothetical protein FRZ06_01065 [Clostridiales bacterium]
MKVHINQNRPGTAPGLIFTAPYTAFGERMIGQTGALIMDQCGDPVWFRPLANRYIQNTDFRVQSYRGRQVLTMWQGTISGTQSANPDLPAGDPEPGAFFQILDSHYRVIKKITAGEGYTADVHEFTITRRNTALFTAVKQVPADLTPYGGPEKGYIDDYSIQEVDLETGELLFFWNTLDHINPADSMLPASSASSTNNIWDCYHLNSVEGGCDGTLLVSMRNMWAIYQIDKKTGAVQWQLGGRKSDFTIAPGSGFSWQHDARYRWGSRISLFDDACCASENDPPQGQSRGLILYLDFQRKTAKADRTYYHAPGLFAASQGNVQQLENCNQFIGWGQEPYLSEFAQGGNTTVNPLINFLYDVRFPNQNISYRSFKNRWIGCPLCPPCIAVRRNTCGVTVYASWNGATEVAAWQVYSGCDRAKLSPVGCCVPRSGFETAIPLKCAGSFYRVAAMDACGKVLGTSCIVTLPKRISHNKVNPLEILI